MIEELLGLFAEFLLLKLLRNIEANDYLLSRIYEALQNEFDFCLVQQTSHEKNLETLALKSFLGDLEGFVQSVERPSVFALLIAVNQILNFRYVFGFIKHQICLYKPGFGSYNWKGLLVAPTFLEHLDC